MEGTHNDEGAARQGAPPQDIERAEIQRFDRVLAGENYLQCCARAAEQGDRTAADHLSALRSVLYGSEDRRQLECREPSEGDAAWFEVSFERLRRTEGGAVITRTGDCDDRGADFVSSQDFVMQKEQTRTIVAPNETTVCWRHDRYPTNPHPGEWSGWSRA